MKTLLIIIAVFNGHPYEEQLKYAVQFDTEAQCKAEQAKYATKGIRYDRAECVPLLFNLEHK